MSHPKKFLLIIGSPKAGTTSLANWLGSRQDMVLGDQKEPNYFTDFSSWSFSGPGSNEFIGSLIVEPTAYFSNFTHKSGATWAIDASTDYLWRSEVAVPKIKDFSKHFPVKLICLTRDPIERAISEYNHTLAAKMETLSFREALNVEAERSAKGYHPLFRHKRRSQIHADLKLYVENFGDDLLTLDFNCLKDPNAANQVVSNFLGVDVLPMLDTDIYNQRLLPRNRAAKWLIEAQTVRRIGRTLTPKALRSNVWERLQKPSAELQTVSEDEISYARNVLADEIALCAATDIIDTNTWTLALQ